MTGSDRKMADLRVGERFDELTATVALIRAKVVPADRLAGLIDEAGSAVALAQTTETDRLFAVPNASHAFVGKVSPQHLSQAAKYVADWTERGIDVRTVLDRSYPDDLREIYNRPPMVFVRGKWPPPSALPTIAVVGTRQASEAGLKRARRLATELCGAGFVVISGLAAGVDTAAHTATLDAGGTTAAVFGTGLDRVYPAENASLAERILESGGALLSQFFPDSPPTRGSFPMRNIVMSGLSKATVVIEASATSGAKMQARIALQHGRTVFLLKSLVESHRWAAEYVEEGRYGTRAIEIASTQDILDRLQLQVPDTVLAVA